MIPDRVSGVRSRRDVLRTGALAAFAVPAGAGLVTACDVGYAVGPDPLLPLLRSARADRDAANTLRGSSTGNAARFAEAAVRVRGAHADALHAEIDRLNRPKPENEPTAPPRIATAAELAKRIPKARGQASALVPDLPPHRAGLIGSVAAGCAGLQEVAAELGVTTERTSVTVRATQTGELPGKAIGALQQALAAEHAAIWVYGLVTAFLPAAFSAGIQKARAQHRRRREAASQVLTKAGVQPRPTEAAYVPAKPVSGEDDAIRVVVTAEQDAAAAWHGVLVRTDDTALRTMANRALIGSAARATRWRYEGGTQPAALALPGKP